MNKQASVAVFASIILIILIFVFAGIIYGGVFKSLSNIDRDICKTSVLAQVRSGTFVGATLLNSLDCPTYNLVVKDDYIETTFKDEKIKYPLYANKKVITKYASLDDRYVYQAVGEELRGCWYQFLEGTQDVFSKEFIGDITDKETFCFPCATISFDLAGGEHTFPRLKDYLKDTSMVKKETHYWPYLTSKPKNPGVTKDWQTLVSEAGLSENVTLTSSEKYFLLFVKEGGGNVLWSGDYFTWIAKEIDANRICDSWVYPAG